MIINEWQLNSELNTALQHSHRADFSLYLSLLSTAIEESAEFNTPSADTNKTVKDIYKQFSVEKERHYALNEADIGLLNRHCQAMQTDGLVQLKLAIYLNPPPLSQFDDKNRLNSDIWQNLSLHSRRRLQQQNMTRQETNPAALYEVLQQLNNVAA
ncbi:VC2046/SO_2500 family protein [Rheinheimera baltica]|uniref:VC2046/SO_2500 family protein n=1 Tax=Rheinheimera baltica TaxID=67576 RepID=A0ABT9HZ00_9GAMM|nr:VC2046/SO_2500 family protein [Rheinheimera baltica]MDP5136352.1 VC2046/SO_2500 family protein [Rheinheimera baltica]